MTEVVAGRLIIEWPKGANPSAQMIALYNSDTGDQIRTATGLVVVANCNAHSGLMYADVTMLADDTGRPLGSNVDPVRAADGGDVLTVTRRWHVTGHR